MVFTTTSAYAIAAAEALHKFSKVIKQLRQYTTHLIWLTSWTSEDTFYNTVVVTTTSAHGNRRDSRNLLNLRLRSNALKPTPLQTGSNSDQQEGPPRGENPSDCVGGTIE